MRGRAAAGAVIASRPGTWTRRSLLRRPTSYILLLLLLVISLSLNLFVQVRWNSVIFPNPNAMQQSAVILHSFYSSPNNETALPEKILWHRMLQDTFDHCSQQKGKVVTVDNSPNATHQPDKLPPLGFSRHIQLFLQQSSLQEQKCLLPSATACRATKYSVLIWTNGIHLRRLFLNIMSFVSYPSALDIIVIGVDRSQLQANEAYGNRLLEWHEKGVIRLVPLHNLWFAMEVVEPQSDTVLWIHGDLPKNWNGTSLKSMLHDWKRNANYLVVPSGRRSLLLVQPGRQERPHDHTPGDDSICPLTGVVPPLHGVMHHRNYLCYFDHPIVSRALRKYVELLGWDVTVYAITILLQQLTVGYLETSWTIPPSTNDDVGFITPSVQLMITNYFGCCSLRRKAIPFDTHSMPQQDICSYMKTV